MQLLFRIALTILLLLAVGLFSSVASQASGTAEITTLTENTILSGIVEVRGTALLVSSAPNDFHYYRLEYARKENDNGQAILVTDTVRSVPVRDGLLDTWNTMLVPNGKYIVRLEVVSNVGGRVGTSIEVQVLNDIPVYDRSAPQIAGGTPKHHHVGARVLAEQDRALESGRRNDAKNS